MASAILTGDLASNQVFYGDVNPDIVLPAGDPWPGFYITAPLDLNNDGADDFTFTLVGTSSFSGWDAVGYFIFGYAIPEAGHQVLIGDAQFLEWCSFSAYAGQVDLIANYANGQLIESIPDTGMFLHPENEDYDNQLLFLQRHKLWFTSSWYSFCAGPPDNYTTAGLWFDSSMRNMPITFKQGTNYYTGWIRLSVSDGDLHVHDYAISMDASENIVAGSIDAAIVAQTPEPGMVSTLATKAYLTWSPVADAIKYRYRYRKTGTTDWTTKLHNGTFRLIKPLECASEYEWQIQAVYDNTPNLNSPWSAIETFTTAACRLGDPESELITDLQVYPNPADASLQINIISPANRLDMFVELYDLRGVKIKSIVTNDRQLHLDISDVSSGTYMLVVHTNAAGHHVEQVVIAH